MDASIFKYNKGTHFNYIQIAYGFLIEAFQELTSNHYNAKQNNENTIRDELVKIAQKKKNKDFIFYWNTESRDLEKSNRIDIELVPPYALDDFNKVIKIECKIVGEDKYIDTESSFNRKNSPTNGIMSFITGKYSPDMPLAGMIGFIKEGKIELKIKNIKNRIDNHIAINTIQNLVQISITDSFNYSYHSKHKRYNGLKKIDIYHLFFDFT